MFSSDLRRMMFVSTHYLKREKNERDNFKKNISLFSKDLFHADKLTDGGKRITPY